MGLETRSFTVYGFKIEVHAGGRRVWPPSFKRFINDSLDTGSLKVEDVTRECNVSQSLVYKWRADVRRAGEGRISVREDRLFSEVIIEEGSSPTSVNPNETHIQLRIRDIEISLPATYAVDDLVAVALSIEASS